MHARELVSISALLTTTSDQLAHSVRFRQNFDADRWNSAYQDLLRRWSNTLDLFDTDLADQQPAHDPWPAIRIVAEEILLAELFIRLVAAAATVSNSDHEDRSTDQAVKAAWIGHLAARRRVLALILAGRRRNCSQAADLDRLRIKIERWTDALLSRLQQLGDVSAFAHDSCRLQDFARDPSLSDSLRQEEARRWEVLCLSVRDTFSAQRHRHSANPKLVNELAQVLRGCLSHMELDRHHTDRSPWLTRLTEQADEMDDLIGEYFRFAG